MCICDANHSSIQRHTGVGAAVGGSVGAGVGDLVGLRVGICAHRWSIVKLRVLDGCELACMYAVLLQRCLYSTNMSLLNSCICMCIFSMHVHVT